jgi:phosphatidylglycerophosphate synthase
VEQSRNGVVSHRQAPPRITSRSLAQPDHRASDLRRCPYPAAIAELALVAAGVAVALAVLPFQGAAAPLAGMALYALAGAIVLARLGRFHPHARFGLANAITVLRAGGVAVLAALALEPALLAGERGWWAAAAAAGLLALDGIDGLAARRQGLASAFGARFDMEVDSGLILVLAVIALGLGKAGPWILGLGLLRYLFVLTGRLVPALARPLPPSRRRSAICVLQVVALGVLLVPPVVPPLSTAIAAGAGALLVASFATDTAWLLRRR